MKMYYIKITAVTVIMAALGVISGCKYDVAEPKWYSDPATTATPVISQITPANVAAPGVNTITIQGVNFGPDAGSNYVYFGTTAAEIKSASPTQIVVYRPNLVSDSCTAIVAPTTTYTPAKFGPYIVSNVLNRYCVLPIAASPDNLPATAIAVDNSENLYIPRVVKYGIFRIDTTLRIDSIAKGVANMTDAVVGLDNRLYLLGTSPSIRVMPLPGGPPTATVPQWVNCGKSVRFGDFAANGYFFAGGTNTNFVIISPALTVYNTDITYITSNVLAVRVAGGFVYVAANSSTTGTKIYKHPVTGDGTLGAQQLVYDWSASPYASSTITSLAFGSDGTIYVGTSAPSGPIVAITALGADYFYKSNLPGYCVQLAWGNAHYLYMLTGNTANGIPWVTYRLDMGATRASR